MNGASLQADELREEVAGEYLGIDHMAESNCQRNPLQFGTVFLPGFMPAPTKTSSRLWP